MLKWNECSLDIMKSLIASKLSRHVEIQQIINTANKNNVELIHFSRMDMYWGGHTNFEKTEITKGHNHLGKIYMSFYPNFI